MASIEEKIRDFGQKRDVEGLQEYMDEIALNELINLVQSKISNANFVYTWNYILQGFTESSDSHKKRFEVVMKVIKELENVDVSSSHCNAIMHRLCMELVKFKTIHLIRICEFCMECLQSQRVSQMSWKELLPELLNVISEKECVEHNNEEITGIEYKHQLINSMCTLQWSASAVTSLTAMFSDISMTKEEHLQVVNKLAQYLEKLTPQEIPSYVYQLLKLCKQSNSKVVFLKLQHYFGVRVYENLANQTDSDSTDFGAIENTNDQDVIEAESTVLFHIHSAASLGHESVKDYLSSLKNTLRSPEFILHPFQLSVLLTISTIPHYEEKVFEFIRSCVSRTYHEEEKKLSSAWFRDMVPSTCKIESVFDQIIKLSAEDRELVLQGLVNFAFLLAGVGSALGRDPIAEKQWQLGTRILIKIIKRKRQVAPVVLQQLSDRIITGQTVTQYIECMYLLSKNLALLLLENKSTIILLMEGLVQMPANNAKQLLDAIIPLTKVSPTIRDHFILLLRKALYARNSETRQVAVLGFLKLLTNLKISNLAALSQLSSSSSYSSGHSLFTQISINRTTQCAPSAFSNEALCLEILSILRRCFMQQADVRIQLYEGLYDAVCLNPELGIPVLEMMWLHFSDFYKMDEDSLPPLYFDKITITKDVTVFLQEPLGKLIYTIGLIVTKVSTTDNENATVIKFTTILESLCSRMINCELVHFDLDDGTDLLDILPESQHKLYILKEAMCVYEGLIGYKIYSWQKNSENVPKQINSLFQGYLRLLQFSKNLSKPKKVDGKKKKDQNKTTQQTANNTTTVKKDGQKSSKTFKCADTILDFQVVNKIMSLLHEPMVTWTTVTQANLLKSKRDFHQHMMQAALCLVSSLKNKKVIDDQYAKMIYGYLCDLAIILYERIIKKLEDFIDFDCATAVLALECFFMIFNVICNNYKSNFKTFLTKVGGKDGEEPLSVHLSEFVETYQKLLEIDENEISEDPEIKKVSLVLVNTINFLSHQIPVTSNALSLQMMDWLKNFAVTKTISSKQVASSFVNVLFDCHIKFKVSLTLLENISICLGNTTGVINEEEHEDVEEFKIITSVTVNNVYTSLCNALKNVMEDIEWIIARLKAEYTMITYPGEGNIEKKKEFLKSRERGVCCQLCFIVTIMTNLSNCTIPPGPLSEVLLKNLILLYNTLSSLTKYFILRSSKLNPVFQGARFERLTKLAGKQLAPVVYNFITYFEECQKQEPGTSQKTKKKNVDPSTLKSKVLKETRLIPKVVYEIEQFSKFVIQLSKKTNIDLSKCVGQGTVRDFRILHLNKVLEKAQDGAPPVTQTTQESDSSIVENETIEDNEDEEESGEENSSPPAKKTKH